MNVPDLRSPHDEVGGVVYFGRMLDKVRLHAQGRLPDDYQSNLGNGFDERCVDFLHVAYEDVVTYSQTHSDDETLEWAFAEGRHPSEEEIEIWNSFMRKRGWNDEASSILERRLREAGCPERTDIQTMFDFIDLDEGRDPRAR